ncbi:MAG: DUF2336 domain-containing protein [Beijerinckiaceae bacterium]
MWPALDALVQNGYGNRQTTTLKAIGALYRHCSTLSRETVAPLFDVVMTQMVFDLDHETIQAIAAAAPSASDEFPEFMAAVLERSQQTPHAFNPAPQAETIPGIARVASELTLPTEPEVASERRARTRDPVEDNSNPITLARRASQAELLQIAAVPNLPEALTNVVISRGDRTVLERALRNPSANFARSSLTTLAELAPSDRMIKEAMVARKDLPEPIIERLLPYLSPEAKARLLLSGAAFSQDDCREALEQAAADLAENLVQGQMMMGLDTCLATLNEGDTSVGEIITLLARDARIAELAAFAATRLDISQAAAFNALSGRIDHAAVVILRAMECDAAAFVDVMNMRRRCGCREARETKSAWNLGQRYSVADALAMARLFDLAVKPATVTTHASDALGVENQALAA